jgi:hypothetical protein
MAGVAAATGIILCPLRDLGSLGPDRRDIHDGFRLSKSMTAYPALWSHDASTMTTLAQSPNGYLSPLHRAEGRASLAVILVWWLLIPPSNNRDWQPDVKILPSAQIDGNMVTIHNIRNCDYRTRWDYTVSYYDKTFDLEHLYTGSGHFSVII